MDFGLVFTSLAEHIHNLRRRIFVLTSPVNNFNYYFVAGLCAFCISRMNKEITMNFLKVGNNE
jgi:hypothetical protein